MQADQVVVAISRWDYRVTAVTRDLTITSGNPEPINAADAILHQAGFISLVTHRGRLHHLPSAMTDSVEQRRAVTHAVHTLRAEGIEFAVDTDLLDTEVPDIGNSSGRIGPQVAELAERISRARHTSEAVDALSELTAPGAGVLDRVTEVLDVTAEWWEGLGEEADLLFASQLRRITAQMGVSILEIQGLRSTLAERYTQHPAHTQPDRAADQEPRVAAAMTRSPAATDMHAAPNAVTAAPATTKESPVAGPSRPSGR